MVLILSLLMTAGCDTSPISHLSIKANYERSQTNQYPETEYRLRHATISDIQYELNMDLTQHDRYAGTMEIRFNYKPTEYPLTIDFKGGEIQRILTNNATTGIDYNGQFVSIPSEILNEGANRIKLYFSHGFKKDEHGLNRFYDPSDQNVYLFFKYGFGQTSQLFPLFEQPDLPSEIMALYTTYNDWQLVTGLKTTKESDRGNYKIWHQSGDNLTSEQFTLFAGDWHLWEGQSDQNKVNILVRDSLKEQIPIRHWYNDIQGAIKKVSEFVSFPTDEIHIVHIPGLYAYQKNYQKVMTLSEQPLLNSSNYAPDWDRHITRHLVGSSLQSKPMRDRWPEVWLTEHIIRGINASSSQNKESDTNPAYTQPMIAPVSSEFKQQIINHSNYFLKHNKARMLLDGLYLVSDNEDLNDAIREFLEQPEVSALKFLESVQSDSSLAMSDWASQWLTVGGINSLISSRHCEQGKIKQFNLVQKPMDTVPIVRQLNIRMYYEQENEIKTEKYEMTSDRMNFKHLDNLSCDAAILIRVENYMIYQSDNLQASLLDLSSRYHNFSIYDLFSEAINSNHQPEPDELASWVHLVRSRLDSLHVGEIESILTMINRWLIQNHFAITPQLTSALQRLSNRLYQMSLNQELSLHDRLKLFQFHIDQVDEQQQMDRLFTWIVGRSEPVDLGRSVQLRLQAFEKLIALGYERQDLLNDFLQEQSDFFNQYELDAIQYSKADADKQIAYLDELLVNPDIRQEQYMPVLEVLIKRSSSTRTELIKYIIGKFNEFERRMGATLLQYWLQPSLYETCQSSLVKSVSDTLEKSTLQDLSVNWLSQHQLVCSLKNQDTEDVW